MLIKKLPFRCLIILFMLNLQHLAFGQGKNQNQEKIKRLEDRVAELEKTVNKPSSHLNQKEDKSSPLSDGTSQTESDSELERQLVLELDLSEAPGGSRLNTAPPQNPQAASSRRRSLFQHMNPNISVIGKLLESETSRNLVDRYVNLSFQDSTQTTKVKAKSPRGAMLRSLTFPGWGQWYNEQYIKSILVFSGITLLIAQTIHFHDKASNAEQSLSERNELLDKRNLRIWLIGAVTLLSMLDAYIDAHLYDFDTGPDLQLRLGMIRYVPYFKGRRKFGISLQAKF